MKGTKKKKHKKTVSYDVGNNEEDKEGEGEVDAANEKKEGEEAEDSMHNENEPSLNVDSLIKDYKVQTQTQVAAKTDFLENLLDEEQPEETEEDTTSSNLYTGTKSTRFSKNFKRDRQSVEKARHNLVKKENEDEDLQRAGQLLKKVTPLRGWVMHPYHVLFRCGNIYSTFPCESVSGW